MLSAKFDRNKLTTFEVTVNKYLSYFLWLRWRVRIVCWAVAVVHLWQVRRW